MIHRLLTLMMLLVSAALTGCLEVEDSNNKKVVAALEEQNEILREQAGTEENSVTLFGSVLNADDLSLIESGSVQISAGLSIIEEVDIVSGLFEAEGLPVNTDIELLIEAEGGFQKRAFYFQTSSTVSGNAYQDTGSLLLYKTESLEFTVVRADNDESVNDLQFRYTTHQGSSSLSVNHYFVSTYNVDTDTYTIELPTATSVDITSDIDLDNDGEADYLYSDIGLSFGTILQVASYDLIDTESISLYLAEEASIYEYEIRLSVLDEQFEVAEGLSIELDGDANELTALSYDASLNQYVGTVSIENGLDILIPSFEANETRFNSSSISISRYSSSSLGDYLRIGFSGDRNFQPSYELPYDQEIIELVMAPYEGSASTELDVVLQSNDLDLNPNRYKVFYSNSISIESENAFLVQESKVEVTRGDDSDSDFVLPGTTLITVEDAELENSVTASLSANDTLLTLQPSQTLSPGFDYRYAIGEIVDDNTGLTVDLFDDSDSFSVQSEAEFSFSEVVLDNDNYNNGGTLIVAENTAGVASTRLDFDSSVLLYFPLSVASLENLYINRVQVIEGSDSDSSIINYALIVNGDINMNLVSTVSTAYNENIDGNSFFNIDNGTSLADGRYYATGISTNLSDHSADESNTVTLEYAYNLPGEATQTGTITLEVQ